MFRGNFKGVSRGFQGSFKKVSRAFQASFKEVLRVCQGCFNCVNRVFKGAPRKLQEYIESFSKKLIVAWYTSQLPVFFVIFISKSDFIFEVVFILQRTTEPKSG